MSQRGRLADARRRFAAGERRQGRLLLVVGLLAVAAVGLRGKLPAPALDGPFRHDALPVGILLEAVLACLLAALIVRDSRAPRDALIAARLRTLLTYLVGVGLVAIPGFYLLSRSVHLKPPRKPRLAPPRLGPPHHGGSGEMTVIIILLALVAAVVMYLVARVIARVIARYRWSWGGWRGREAASVAFEPSSDAETASLRQAVESGQGALRLLDDARAAIIACYVAMEQSLLAAGTALDAADTPDELLARAAGQGLIRTAAAGTLTALFYEARFSSHPMPERRRDDAQRALAELAASLAAREPVPGAPG
jgi:hypothetical protein